MGIQNINSQSKNSQILFLVTFLWPILSNRVINLGKTWIQTKQEIRESNKNILLVSKKSNYKQKNQPIPVVIFFWKLPKEEKICNFFPEIFHLSKTLFTKKFQQNWMVGSGLGGNLVLNMCFVPKTGKNLEKNIFKQKKYVKLFQHFSGYPK